MADCEYTEEVVTPPSDTLVITQNGTYDIRKYKEVIINIGNTEGE